MLVSGASVAGLEARHRCRLRGESSGASEWGAEEPFRPFVAEGRLRLTVTDPGFVMTTTLVDDAALDALPEGFAADVRTVDLRTHAALRIQAWWTKRRSRLRTALLLWRLYVLGNENRRLSDIALQIDAHAGTAEAELEKLELRVEEELDELERKLARERIKGAANAAELKAVKAEAAMLQRHNREMRTVVEEQDDEIQRLRRVLESDTLSQEEAAWRRISDVV